MQNLPNTPEEVDLVPLSLFSERHKAGWRLVPGYPLQPGDYAATMMPPRLAGRDSNYIRATVSRQPGVDAKRWEKARKRMEKA